MQKKLHGLLEGTDTVAARVLDLVILVAIVASITAFEKQLELFSSIPVSLWAIVTLTTIGYGDSCPVTATGKVFTSAVLLIGLAVLAIPKGIISAGLMEAMERKRDVCPLLSESGAAERWAVTGAVGHRSLVSAPSLPAWWLATAKPGGSPPSRRQGANANAVISARQGVRACGGARARLGGRPLVPFQPVFGLVGAREGSPCARYGLLPQLTSFVV